MVGIFARAIDELIREARDPRTWMIFGLIVFVLAYSGPFETSRSLPLGGRLAYWSAIVLFTYAAGSFAANVMVAVLTPRALPAALMIVGIGAPSALPVFLVILIINILAFGAENFTPAELLTTLLFAMFISTAVTAVSFVAARRNGANETESAPLQSIKLIQRLPHHKRGTLISMTVQDHYVDVTTSKGNELLLMRLGDAIAETEGCAGAQVHRSHWVALDAISDVKRTTGRVILVLKDGRELPVSRSFQPLLKEIGVL